MRACLCNILNGAAEVRQIHLFASLGTDRQQIIHVIHGVELLNVFRTYIWEPHPVQAFAAQVGIVTRIQELAA